jgi:3-hydroxyacyl-[acyl-carrier-protein] dehydratase
VRFLFFDHLREVQPGKRVSARKTVSLDGAYYNEHFRGQPVLPGTLVVEAIAQAAGWLNFITHGESIRMIVAAVDHVEFLRPVLPGDTLELEARILFLHPEGATIEGEARVDGQLVATVGRLLFANQPVDRSSLSPRERAHFEYIRRATRAPARPPA